MQIKDSIVINWFISVWYNLPFVILEKLKLRWIYISPPKGVDTPASLTRYCTAVFKARQKAPGLQKSLIWTVCMCVSTDSKHTRIHNLFTPLAPVPTPAHRPTPQHRAHPQSTVTKGKSWAQDIRLPLAARVCPAQCFLQIAAVWAKPPLCLLTIDGTWVGSPSVRAETRVELWGLCLARLVWLCSFTAG